MSTAATFAFKQPFPFCPSDISGTVIGGTSFVGNLTNADLMPFFWNLETLTLTLTGTVTTASDFKDVSGDVVLFPPSAVNNTKGAFNLCAMSDAATTVVFASLPQAAIVPRSRVCKTGTAVYDFIFQPASSGFTGGQLITNVGTDTINAGKLRLYYFMNIITYTGDKSGYMVWKNNDTGGSIANGTITIAGIAMNWYSYKSGTAYTGGTMTASSTSFSY